MDVFIRDIESLLAIVWRRIERKVFVDELKSSVMHLHASKAPSPGMVACG